IHLGMSGRVTIHQVGERQKHDHFILRFTNGSQLVFNDPRRFGFVDLIETKNLLSHQFLTSLGLEPISADFNSTYLQTKLRNKITNIKTALMDNKLVVGVGNIYANESLFDAGILPLRSAKSLTKSDLSSLVSSVKKIITKAIRLGGSSISDYVDSRGESGKFQNSFKVYGRGGEKCLQCSRAIQRVVQAGRASFYCSQCQT
ncbi:MAG: bifunctional DNA-formamidopyrimidine glycosylase/DNA-(apurinic or apyrimidinic site) lyase, partial [Alphaproteobacteria bacterium]|nr:bifunctional DNA-formamidopyrimidine glycosylase/DNA-(apurinic or apyrimidinic site) lyase [Alphaproteobacteria bacterium]